MYSKINWIILIVILFVGIIIIGFLTIKKPEYSNKITSKEIIAKYLKEDNALTVNTFVQNSNKNEYLLIDVSFPGKFVKGHFLNAVNIPFSDLLSDEYKNIFNNEKQKLIYAENEITALQAWLILCQIGYKNIKYLKAGYDIIQKANANDSLFNPKSTDDECLLYDFNSIKNVEPKTNKATVKTEKKEVKVKTKPASPSGGC